MGKDRTENIRVFRAKTRILFDSLLILDSAFFVVSTGQFIPAQQLIFIAACINAAIILFWYGIASPLATIRIEQGTIKGRSGSFQKTEFPLRRVNHAKTMASIVPFLKWFYKDVWSIDGQSIRLHRRIIGQDQVRRIMVIIQEYPFKEKGSAEPKLEPPPSPRLRYKPDDDEVDPDTL